MSKIKITGGEWCLPHFARKTDEQSCDCGFIFANECEQCIGAVYFKIDDSTEQSEYPDIENAIANAKLICAAPDLLEGCRAAIAIFQSEGINEFHPIVGEVFSKIITAMKKAVS
jgi:hypothetical protein